MSAKSPAPISGGTLLVLRSGKIAVAAEPDRDAVFVVDLERGTVSAVVALAPGDEPGRLAEDNAGRVHVVARRGGALITFAPASGAVLGRRSVCEAPRGLAFDSAGDALHVACAGGELVTIPAAPDAEGLHVARLADDLRDVILQGDHLLVSTFRQAELLTVSRDGRLLGRAALPAKTVTRAKAGSTLMGAPETTSVTEHRSASVAWRLLPGKAGEAVMLHQSALDDVVSDEQGGYGNECNSIVETELGSVSPVGLPGAGALKLPGAALAVDFAISPDRGSVAVVAPGNAGSGRPQLYLRSLNEVSTNASAGGDPECAPGVPAASALQLTQPQGQATAVAFAGSGDLVVQTREPSSLQVLGKTSRFVPFSLENGADRGHRMFHTNIGAAVVCASCHPEGGEDARAWSFAKIGARRTQTLRGGVTSTAPYHWDGSLRTVADLVKTVFVGRMGGPPMDAGDVTSLDHWLAAIPAMPARTPADASAVSRGRTLFSGQAGCLTCHNGSLMTNNVTMDVGTGRSFQVPSLRGLSWHAPFMHDGCAKTLSDRFTTPCAGDSRHGATAGLSARQLTDLVAFLETL